MRPTKTLTILPLGKMSILICRVNMSMLKSLFLQANQSTILRMRVDSS